jgi:hypothetical protein
MQTVLIIVLSTVTACEPSWLVKKLTNRSVRSPPTIRYSSSARRTVTNTRLPPNSDPAVSNAASEPSSPDEEAEGVPVLDDLVLVRHDAQHVAGVAAHVRLVALDRARRCGLRVEQHRQLHDLPAEARERERLLGVTRPRFEHDP